MTSLKDAHERRANVVRDARDVVEQLTERDAICVWQDAEQPSADGVFQAQTAFADELQRHYGGEGLDDAADAHAVPRAQGSPGPGVRDADGRGVSVEVGHGAGRTAGHHALERVPRRGSEGGSR